MPASIGDLPDADPPARLWIGAQLPPALAGWFRSHIGLNATHVEQLGLITARDRVTFSAAPDATGPVVVMSKDDDFGKLVRQFGPPSQVVWLRVGNVGNQELS